MNKVLIVEDDQDISGLISVNLTEMALQVTQAPTGEKGLELALEQTFDLIVLDVMLPGMSGLDVCRILREKKPEQAILMVTSRNSEVDRVLGLELGADDYMTKPFSIRELQARVRSQLRRAQLLQTIQQDKAPEQQLIIGRLQINHLSHQAILGGEYVDLTATEYDLLAYLASHPEQVFSRSQLLSSVWGYDHSGYEHTVNSHINRLRSKVEKDATKPEIVQTVWGVGYKFCRQGVAA